MRLWDRTPDGQEVHELVVGRPPGPVLHLLTLGATVHRLRVTDAAGRERDVALGLATARDQLASTDFVGGTIGRYANRIAHGRFELEGREVQVGVSDRGHHLHGGPDGFDRRIWGVASAEETSAVLTLHSPDGDQGFPGALDVTLAVEVDSGSVRLRWSATTDAPTVCNLTTHTYLNLDGPGTTIDDHRLQVPASRWTPIDDTGIPLGDHVGVEGTPCDLRRPRRLGDVVRADHPQLVAAAGIDHNFVIDGGVEEGIRRVATLTSGDGTLALELRSDQPGLQVYTGNHLDGAGRTRTGARLRQGDGIALEPQVAPDSPRRPVTADWPSCVLQPGETYRTALDWLVVHPPGPPGT